MPKGRTPKYTAEQMVEALRTNRGRLYLAAKQLGCHVDTIRNYAKQYVSVQRELDSHRGLRLDNAENALDKAVERGDPWAVKYILSTLGKERGYTERQEVTGAEGEAIRHKHTHEFSDDELAAIAAGRSE